MLSPFVFAFQDRQVAARAIYREAPSWERNAQLSATLSRRGTGIENTELIPGMNRDGVPITPGETCPPSIEVPR